MTPEASRMALDYFRDSYFDSVEEAYETAHDYMTECLEELMPPVSPSASLNPSRQSINPSTHSCAQLPPIRLPPFDGSYDQWEQFRDRFTTLILHNKDISDFVRMHYLTSCVTGRALECIGNIPVTADNFVIAWDALVARFENKRRLLRHISALLMLSAIPRESAYDLQALCDQINITVASLNSLHRTPEKLWNDILVHVIVQ
ncbi:uncharacterized protein LOC105184040 [Harpegnathos saltator]|uniref:uncharacterized protein LOC105184040 n=1 Tax=Harpegnathos saltator TaxID=610380 RepID=UPI000590DAFE|nr:uncharacterized protein LOC105184040 [Harpegnathos saltator]